jgi:multiple antibiotic resistance protein
VVPLAVPLIVGPATMTTSLLLVNTYAKKYEALGMSHSEPFAAMGVCVALVINLAFLLWVMWYSDRLVALVGKNTLAVVNKIVMILIAGIAVSLIRQGITSIVTDLQRGPATAHASP